MISKIISLPQLELTLLREALQFLSPNEDRRVWLVGGTIRDYVFNKKSSIDLDLAVSFDPVTISRKFAFRNGDGFVVLDEERQVIRIVKTIDGIHNTIDIARFRADDINADLKERDFTINAMAAELTLPLKDDLEIYDPLGGLNDVANKKIVPCSNHLFENDPLRLMRAIRFSAVFQSELSSELATLIKRDCKLLKKVSGERIRDELFKTLKVDNSSKWVKVMHETGLLEQFLPELTIAKGVEQNEWHHLDVFDHTLLTLETLETLLDELKEGVTPKLIYNGIESSFDGTKIIAYLNEPISGDRTYLQTLKLSALLHDIGKTICRRQDIKADKITFHGHEMEGVYQCKKISERLKLSSLELTTLQKLVKNHMRPGVMLQQGLSDRLLFRFFSETGRDGLIISILSLADRFSALGNTTKKQLDEFKAGIFQIITEFYKQQVKPKQAPLINGKDLIDNFQLKGGPVFKDILDAIKEAQYLGEVSTKQEAIELASKIVESTRL